MILIIVKKKCSMNKEKLITTSVASEELNEICEKCDKICRAKRFQQNFKNWTSGNSDIDKLIQDTQLGHDLREPLEWMPYDNYIAKGGLAKSIEQIGLMDL